MTISRANLAQRLRLGRTNAELDEADELLAEATEAVINFAPNAPDVMHNAAVWRYCSYAYDRPFASVGTRFANVMRHSGAASVLAPYRVHHVGSTNVDEPADTTGAEEVLIQQTPFTVTDTPQDITASYAPGRFKAEVTEFGDTGVLYATGAQPPATDAGYFVISFTTDRQFDFVVGSTPTWVKSQQHGQTSSLAVARYAA